MRLLLLVICSVLLLSYEKAVTWAPCQPFCDLACTGVAAAGLSVDSVMKYAQLSTEEIKNNSKILDVGNALVNQQANLFSAGGETLYSKVRALDGLSKKVTLTLESLSVEQEKRFDYIANQLFILKKSNRKADMVIYNRVMSQASDLVISETAIKAIPELISAIEDANFSEKEANLKQFVMSQSIGSNNLNNQRLALLKDVDFSLPNPFTSDLIDRELWDAYQKFIFLTFNFKPLSDESSIQEKRQHIKRQIALSAVNKILTENTEIRPDNAGQLIPLASRQSLSLKHALFDTFKQQQLDLASQLNVKASAYKSLLIIHNTQLAQRNMMLNELLKIKQLRNTLKAIAGI